MENFLLYKEIIVNILFGLGQEGDVQVGFYPDFIPVTDELILTLESSFLLAMNLKNNGMLKEEIFTKLKLLYEQLKMKEVFILFNQN